VTSQALKYDVITYTPYEGLKYTILDKTMPLWKSIGEPPEIQIGCYRGDPGHQRHSGSSYDLFWLTELNRWKVRLRHWSCLLLSFWLVLSFPCDVMLRNNKWENSHDNFFIVEKRTSQSNDNATVAVLRGGLGGDGPPRFLAGPQLASPKFFA